MSIKKIFTINGAHVGGLPESGHYSTETESDIKSQHKWSDGSYTYHRGRFVVRIVFYHSLVDYFWHWRFGALLYVYCFIIVKPLKSDFCHYYCWEYRCFNHSINAVELFNVHHSHLKREWLPHEMGSAFSCCPWIDCIPIISNKHFEIILSIWWIILISMETACLFIVQ